MQNWFAEKQTQVEPSELTAFGIKISSRYGIARELGELLSFAEECAGHGVAHYVKEAFYNSKGGECNLGLDSAVKEGDPVADAILECAREHIAYFFWFDRADYGKPMEKFEGADKEST